MISSNYNSWRHRFALLTALATLVLIGIGGLVTSHGVGMSVPDWPTSYGYNMFALPFSIWFTGGVFHEHTHRQWASVVGVLVVILTRWLGGKNSRRPILWIGAIEMIAGLLMFKLGDQWRGAGGFLCGIGGVVLLAGLAWVKNAPAPKPLPALGWWAFWLVQFQGLLGGLRVVLDAHEIAGLKLGMLFGIFHACLAQGFFVLLCVIAWTTSRRWMEHRGMSVAETAGVIQPGSVASLRWLFAGTTLLIFLQLILGATMRHQHAGLAIPDFPLAYGKVWPATDPGSIQLYNQQRVEVSAVDPITAFQVHLQMIHRVTAILILMAVAISTWFAIQNFGVRHPIAKTALLWLGLILTQVGFGAATVLTHKAADIATGHVVVGVLSLATGAMLCIFRPRSLEPVKRKSFPSKPALIQTGTAVSVGSPQS
jgi:cytochrome c oxidase assembly protein subunit 15